ncbi:bile acid-CoA:amino acid N-acyltransferase-like [Clarias magur]|uniref:Bile acid-CoA:amino acid N-acyltransferase-like n=1 Tax=Clarias magur TaxID=1594786 RepID=A0A8J4U5B1_CLAMG|nr:bile acid-CoA:amino acid N-acyltransferase-like [Clarias magur]
MVAIQWSHAGLEVERRHKAGKSHLFTQVSYPGVGHLIEPPYAPTALTSVWTNQPRQYMVQWGGNLKQHAAAQEDSWQNISAKRTAHNIVLNTSFVPLVQ